MATDPSRRRTVMDRTLRALRVRNFRAYFFGQLVSNVGSWMQMMAQSWLVLELTDSGKSLGLTMALQMLPVLVIGSWGGVIADRVNNRRLLVVTALAGVAQSLALGTMVATGHITVHWIYLFALLLGCITAFDRPAMQALIYELVAPEELASAIGISSTINAGGRLMGPAIAGLVIATLGMAPVFFMNAASFAAVLVALAVLRVSEMYPRQLHKARVRLRDGFSYVLHEPTLRLTMGVMTVVGLCAFNFGIVVPAMIKFEFHAGAGALGITQGIGGVGSVLGGLAVGSLMKPTPRVLGLVSILFGACIAIEALIPSLLAFSLLWFPLGMAATAFTTLDQTVLQRTTAPEYQGRVMSMFTIAWMGTTPIGGIIVGFVIDGVSARAALALGAASALLSGLVALAVTARKPDPEQQLVTVR